MTYQVPLTQGAFALIDDCDAELILPRRWHCKTRQNGTQYAGTNIKGEGRYHWVAMHRLILSPPPGVVIDHIDGNGLNNTRSNLRICSQKQNMANRRGYGKSQFLGVAYNPGRQFPWAVQCAGQYVGSFIDEIQAAAAYDYVAKARHGEFARLNFPGNEVPFDRSRLRDGKAPKSRLPAETIRAIKAAIGTTSNSALARRFGVSPQYVGLLARGMLHRDQNP